MDKRRWKDILKELKTETDRDAYYCRADSLRAIVNELVEEMEYAQLIKEGDL